MKRTLMLGAIAGLLACSSALAADLPRKAQPAPIVMQNYNWTGWYVGVSAGFARNDEDQAISGLNPASGLAISSGIVSPALSTRPDGWLFGAQIGHNWQLGRMVVGLELTAHWADVDGSDSRVFNPGVFLPFPLSVTTAGTAHLDWYATAQARIGYLLTDTVLIYGKGGLAYGDRGHTTTITLAGPGPFNGTASGSASDTELGWTAGAGLEVALPGNWRAFVDYSYLDLGTSTATFTGTVLGVAFPFQSVQDHTYHIVKGGLNYAF